MLFYQTSTVFTLLVPLLVRGNPVPIPIPIPIPIPAPAPNNPAVTPITFDCNNAPENCQNMCWAALCRHAGGVALVDANNNVVVNPYSSLHYSKSGTNYVQDSKGKNREMDNRALSGASKANNDLLAQSGIGIPAGGKSTDEWPQASSQEGGLGATLRQVPGNEQSSQGGQTAELKELADGAPYQVNLINWQNLNFCVALSRGDMSVCANTDKTQFYYDYPGYKKKGGKFYPY